MNHASNKLNRTAYRWWLTMIFSLAWLACSAAAALAISVPILNMSFESPWVEYFFSDGDIDDWVITGEPPPLWGAGPARVIIIYPGLTAARWAGFGPAPYPKSSLRLSSPMPFIP